MSSSLQQPPGPGSTRSSAWRFAIPLGIFLLLVFFLWRTLKLMPKTKPTEITPDSASAVEWSQVAGADEAKAELQEVVDFL